MGGCGRGDHSPHDVDPSKLELLQVWLPRQSWFTGDAASLTKVGGFRLDDPAGEVGIESLLVADAPGRVYHVPLTYRAAPRQASRSWAPPSMACSARDGFTTPRTTRSLSPSSRRWRTAR